MMTRPRRCAHVSLLEAMAGSVAIVVGLVLAGMLIAAVGWTAVALADETELAAAWRDLRSCVRPRSFAARAAGRTDVTPAASREGSGVEVSAGDTPPGA